MRTACANIVESHSKVSRDDIFDKFTRWFRLVSHIPAELARFRESLGKVDSQDWDQFWIFGPGYLAEKSLLPPTPDEQNTASAEAGTWRHSPMLTGFLKSFIRSHRRLALTSSRRALVLTMLSAKPEMKSGFCLIGECLSFSGRLKGRNTVTILSAI